MNLLRAFFLIPGTIFSFAVFAQNTLQYAIEEPAVVVKTPYIHWDYLRTLAPEWVREDRSTPTAPWQPLNHAVSEKDADGRFTFLAYKTWSPGQNTWAGIDYTYVYVQDANSRITEIHKYSKGQFVNDSQETYYEYNTLGQISKTTSRNGTVTTKINHSYNSQGLRDADSSFYILGSNPLLSRLTYYEYDANNNCIKSTQLVFKTNTSSWDTSEILKYTYQGGLLSSKEAHNGYTGGAMKPYSRFEYTYTNGMPADVTVYEVDAAAQQLKPALFYTHHYTNNRLTAMLSGSYNGSDRKNTDSVVFTYLPNNMFDTGYQYNALGAGWETAARFRLVFGKLNTGLAPVMPLVNSLKLYPNPVADYLALDIQLMADGSFGIDITDVTGKVVKTVNVLNMPAGENTIKVSVADLPAGVYFITCGNKTEKIIKQ